MTASRAPRLLTRTFVALFAATLGFVAGSGGYGEIFLVSAVIAAVGAGVIALRRDSLVTPVTRAAPIGG